MRFPGAPRASSSLLLFLVFAIYASSFSLSSAVRTTPPLLIEQSTSPGFHSDEATDVDSISLSHIQAVEEHCSRTLYPEVCAGTLAAVPDLPNKSLPDLIAATVERAGEEVRHTKSKFDGFRQNHLAGVRLTSRQHVALSDCLQLSELTLDSIRAALANLPRDRSNGDASYVQTLLSAAMTNQDTCLDGFEQAGASDSIRPAMEYRMRHISHMLSNSLAMVTRLPKKEAENLQPQSFEGYGTLGSSSFPSWLPESDRRLLLQAPSDLPTINAIVAKDGSGKFTKIADAIAAASSNAGRYVIYVKAGTYMENVDIASSKKNIMLVGDGMDKTVIKASLNVVDGATTYNSATVAVVGTGFIARDISFENAAGPSKHQAVALRSNSDMSVFYRCRLVGYQDTLYVHSLRQFYRECDIYGTVDFIFGNAAVVFQNCNLYARKPDAKQQNLFTAQGRVDPNQNTGISIQNCKIAAASDLLPVQGSFKSYLGRPWKMYSRTVVMQSQIDSLIDPAGWMPWDGDFALKTLYYGEYQNKGAGASTANRVKWPGYKVITSSTEAAKFTVENFIQGKQWLPSTSVPFNAGL